MKKDQQPPFRFSPNPNRAHEVNWHEWGEEAFRLARKQDKPVLVDISATWCHWCHVMDETTYSDDSVINILNRDYIPIRVDTDQHPEINRRYNQGGWPSTAFLTPKGDLITGSTYIAPPQMAAYLGQVRDFYHRHKAQIEQKVIEFEKQKQDLLTRTEKPGGILTMDVVKDVGQIILSRFDQVHGGFGTEPKFPHPAALIFALQQGFESGDEHWQAVIEKTLPAMADGGMFDHVEGGFFRYSTTRDWSIPHFEKMLEDNSLLLDVYLQAFQVTGDERFKNTALKVIEFLDSKLLNPRLGVFGGSQEADEEYFHLNAKERANRANPGVDSTIFTDWNALAAKAFLRAYSVLGDDSYLQRALGILGFLFDEVYDSNKGMYHFWNGEPQLPGLLIDQVRTIDTLMDAYETTFDRDFLTKAEALASIALRDYLDPIGGFFDISSQLADQEHGAIRNRGKFVDENSFMADAMLKLSRLTGNILYRVTAETALSLYTETYRDYELFAAPYGLAIAHILRAPVQVTIVGSVSDPKTKAFMSEGNKVYAPDKVIYVLDPVEDRQKIAELGYVVQPEPVAYLCLADECLPPVTEPSEMGEAIKEWERA